jgi:cell division protein FtsX
MTRLILLVAFIAVLFIAITAVLGTLQAVTQSTLGKDEDRMPVTFSRIAYMLLVVLMFGVTSGWLGAA